MERLRNKSIENYKATELLISSKTYSVAVHCAYYSSFQLAMYYVLSYSVNENEFDSFINKVKNGKGSHNEYINKLVNEVRGVDKYAGIDLYKAFNSFKSKRKDADYEMIEIDEDDAKKSFDFATELNNFLNNFFKNGKITEFSKKIF